MKCNMGRVDRIVRAVVGLALLGWGLAAHTAWGLVGIVPLGTALVAWCPLYVPLRLSTCRRREH